MGGRVRGEYRGLGGVVQSGEGIVEKAEEGYGDGLRGLVTFLLPRYVGNLLGIHHGQTTLPCIDQRLVSNICKER